MKSCPHCDQLFNPGAIFNAHERKCARDHGKSPTAPQNNSVPKKTEPKPPVCGEWAMWNRGQWRGWAVGLVSKLTPSIVRLNTPHLGELVWNRSAFEEDVREGRIFFINPSQILLALAEQLENKAEDEDGFSDSVAMLRSAAAMVEKVKKRGNGEEAVS